MDLQVAGFVGIVGDRGHRLAAEGGPSSEPSAPIDHRNRVRVVVGVRGRAQALHAVTVRGKLERVLHLGLLGAVLAVVIGRRRRRGALRVTLLALGGSKRVVQALQVDLEARRLVGDVPKGNVLGAALEVVVRYGDHAEGAVVARLRLAHGRTRYDDGVRIPALRRLQLRTN